jgi:tight adherence protein C
VQLALGIGLLTVAVALAVLTVGTQLQERAAIRTSLRRLDDFGGAPTRDEELAVPMRTRAIAPIFRSVVDLGRNITPTGYSDKVRVKLVRAGTPEPEALDRFLVVKLACLALVPVAAFLILGVAGMSGLKGFAVAGLLVFALIAGPDAVLNRKVEERAHAVRVALPDVLDMLVISVEAGLGFEQALDRVVENVPGPLSDEFSRMLGEVRAGSSRAEALRAMEARMDLRDIRSFILTMIQADQFGVSIGRILRQQADEMRIRRRQYAQELAQKAPVKMLVPMVFCIFPALFVVVLGPAILDIMEAF